MGMHIVSFAQKEPKLFELLFADNKSSANKALNTLKAECIKVIVKENKIVQKQAKMIFNQMWIFTFGLATLSAMKVYEYSEYEISDLLTKAFLW